ncbi:MAG: HD domain-containing phosphohydrolase [Anaerolineales bacterium]
MSPLSPTHARLITAGTLSLLAQAVLLPPASLGLLQNFFPSWGSSAIGLTFFAISLYFYTWTFRSLRMKSSIGWLSNGLLLAIQLLTVIGIFFILENNASRDAGAGFLLTSLITLLTTYLMIPAVTLMEDTGQSDPQTDTKRPELNSDTAATINALKEQINSLAQQLNTEKHRTTQLTLLNELSQQLETELDPPVSAQLAVNTLERAIICTMVTLMIYEAEKQEFVVLAAAGKMTSSIPSGYRQDAESGLLGRTKRIKKTQIINDVKQDPDFISVDNHTHPGSIISVPILHQGHVKGVLEISSDKTYAFNSTDAAISEGVASELMRAWDRSGYQQRLTELIQAGISLTTLLDPQAAVQEVALIARKTLEARFVFVTLLDQQGNFSRTAFAGNAPRLLATMEANASNDPLMQAALSAVKPFRVRDMRKYSNTKKLEIDHAGLRSVLAIPIRLHRLSIGTILAFGKQEGVFFSENDESLADLLSSQAAASIESSWLYQELRSTLNITSMLYQLSVEVIQTEELSNAAELIAQGAHKVTNSRETGIVLLTRDGQVEAEVEIDTNGLHTRREHPMETVNQAIQTGQSIIVSVQNGSLVCYPLLTRGRTYGALWMSIPESRGQNFANMQTLANQAAIALERSILLSESRQQAKQIEAAYEELEMTYDRTLTALMSALDARDQETEGHSIRVSRLACLLAEEVGLNGAPLKALERGALLHDIGKIGISDSILHKPGKLTEEEWKLMQIHPDIGARIVEGIPFLQETLPVIRYHHERWDGSGYPVGLKEKDIPIQARIFAVADVFDALTSSRSYRNKSSAEDAVQYLREQSGIQFDSEIVEALANIPYKEFIEVEKTST